MEDLLNIPYNKVAVKIAHDSLSFKLLKDKAVLISLNINRKGAKLTSNDVEGLNVHAIEVRALFNSYNSGNSSSYGEILTKMEKYFNLKIEVQKSGDYLDELSDCLGDTDYNQDEIKKLIKDEKVLFNQYLKEIKEF